MYIVYARFVYKITCLISKNNMLCTVCCAFQSVKEELYCPLDNATYLMSELKAPGFREGFFFSNFPFSKPIFLALATKI